jgi:hypothetical protein
MSAKSNKQDKGRFSFKRKQAAVLRLLRGEDLDTLSRELGITAARLSQWRDEFLAAGEAGLKSRQPDSRDEEIARLKEKVGELTMSLEVSREAGGRLQRQAPRPLDQRKSK